MKKHYDYIIAGGGCAGLSLLYQILQSPVLQQKQILLLDKAPKTENDRTWCFWEATPGPFEAIVHHQWPKLWVHEGDYSGHLTIAPFVYKMIKGVDFYQYIEQALSQQTNVTRIYQPVTAIKNKTGLVEVEAGGQTYTADWCFNSILFKPIEKKGCNYLDQHFRGWFIKTETDVFDPGEATLMDFRTPQQGETRFLYLLPNSAREALVEVAIFSNKHLSMDAYDQIIHNYLTTYWPEIGNYELVQTESGVIPMTDYPFKPVEGRVVNIGTAGGDTKASTGYTFWRIQQRVRHLANRLELGKHPGYGRPWFQQRFALYDSMLLRVLVKEYFAGDKLFGQLFRRNEVQQVLRFLNGATSFKEDLKLMSTTPISVFIRVLPRQIVQFFFKRSKSGLP